ncbi:PREDICTED: phosphorylated adapter RNA export protein [Dufourea novaeangliae]|uniref:Phosphorylated adapter RNA export protein n=1 Tax=Dufourea novaeangliae TaxID=178035 RepID=A0A154NXC2_DUFNO|nr:PREDICTED: phosphorylated adapter RNA export protein [Dufourea novaeangliae]KZC04253.1 Phosphorylated adapter RNA export protein [Dufourea novaeangliae]
MEAEPLELEDGEVIDDEASDIETYNVLKRPHASSNKEEPAKIGYNDESDDSVDSESDSDSDSGHVRSKKPKLKLKRSRNSTKTGGNKNDKYKIWCTQVQEDSLTEDLVLCGVTKKRYQERNVENYNLPHHYSVNGSWNMEHHNNNSSEDEKETERRLTNKRTNSDRNNIKLRLGKRRNAMDVDHQKGTVRKIADLSTTVESTDADVATDITSKLNEKKDVLIRRIVDIIGKEKAIGFFQKTKKIEQGGGMLIMNGSRRRTAGGVYLWLVKNDEHIPQEKIREIFYYDKKEHAEQRKADATARRQKAQELIKCLESGSEKDLPALLTKAELSTKEIAEEARLRRGEGMDRMPIDSDRTVTNPPPSPVTDDPDHSEHPLVQRHIQDYEDDFLDVGIDVDSMEVL